MVIWPSDQFEARRYVQGPGWDGASTVLSTQVPAGLDKPTQWRAVTADEAENWTVVWSESGSGLWSRRRDAGSGWQSPQLLAADVFAYDLSLRPDGSGAGVWYEEQTNGDYNVWAIHFDPVTGVVDQRQVGPAIPGVSGEFVVLDVSVDAAANGRAAISWRQYDGYDFLSLWASVYDPGSGAWSAPVRVEDSDEDVLGYASTNYAYEPPAIGIDDEGNAIAVWTQSDGTDIRVWTAHYYLGTGWTDPLTLDAVGAANSRVFDFKMNSAGDAVVLWRDGGALRARHYEVPGTVGNESPLADAGPDRTVDEGAAVSLDGSAASDPDGTIAGYAWAQTAGPAVTLSEPDTANPGFTAPQVSTDTVLIFELTVTDDQGATDTDSVTVTVQDAASGGDTTPPTTTATLTSSASGNQQTFDITLSADEPATTQFRITGTFTITAGGADSPDWQEYTGPIQGEKLKKDKATLEYYSTDPAGNQEATQAEELK